MFQRDTMFSIFSYQINVFANASRFDPGQGVCGKRGTKHQVVFFQQIYKPFADQHSSTEADASAAVVRTGEPKALDHKVELSQHHLQAPRKAAHHLPAASPREYLRCQTRRLSLKPFQWMSQRPALAVIRFPFTTSLALSLSG
jgi:hypothetical protein